MPRKKGKCSQCGKYIHTRSNQTLFSSVLLTEAEAAAVDALREVEYLGITAEDYKRVNEKLSAKMPARPADVMWSLYQEHIRDLIKEGRLHELKMTYYQMALFLSKEGGDFSHVLSEAHKWDLIRFQQGGLKKVRVLAGDHSCPVCQKQRDKIFDVSEALKIMPLPCKGCTFQMHDMPQGFCRCSYVVGR